MSNYFDHLLIMVVIAIFATRCLCNAYAQRGICYGPVSVSLSVCRYRSVYGPVSIVSQCSIEWIQLVFGCHMLIIFSVHLCNTMVPVTRNVAPFVCDSSYLYFMLWKLLPALSVTNSHLLILTVLAFSCTGCQFVSEPRLRSRGSCISRSLVLLPRILLTVIFCLMLVVAR